MAQRAVSISRVPGILAAAFVAAVILVSLISVLIRAETGRGLGPGDWAAIRFTVGQALVSTILSAGLAIPLARAIARNDFPGRRWIILLLGAPFLLPAIAAVMGLLAMFGRNGWLNAVLTAAGFETVSIYGFHGVVLAHLFFNLPLATRLILQGWQDIPAEQFRLAAQLRLPRQTMFRVIELPMLTKVLPGAAGLVFVLCLTSFAVALILGGGPKATTIELAIYQAFRFEFDLARAALLSVIQMAVALSACLVLFRVLPKANPGQGLGRVATRWDRAVWDIPIIALGVLFLLTPIASILATGLPAMAILPDQIWEAALRSALVALVSAAVMLALALPLAALTARHGGVEAIGLLGIATSPLMIGTGLFILVYPFANPTDLALAVTALVNAVMALPFVLRILVPGLREAAQDFDKLSRSLGLHGWRLWYIVLLPSIRAPIGFALGLTAALSIGDLGVIALFADSQRATLPLAIEHLLAAYRTEQAAGATLLLAAMSFGIFALFDVWGRRGA